MAPRTASIPDALESVAAKVRAAHRVQLLLVAAESSIVGFSAGIAVLAAAMAARADPADPQTVALLVLASVLAAASWWLERVGDVASIARALDRRAGLRGALFTAFEADSTRSRSELVAALAHRVAPAASARRFLESQSRASLAVLAAPFLAAALYGAVAETRTSSEASPALATNGASGSATAHERLEHLRAEALRLASSPQVRAEHAAELSRLVERVDEIRSRAASPGAAIDLERESADISRRISALARAQTRPGVAPGDPEGTMGGPEARIDRPTDGPMRETAPPTPPQTASQDAPPAAAPGVEGGVGASRWWPERYDGVVERWIEARRSASGDRPR